MTNKKNDTHTGCEGCIKLMKELKECKQELENVKSDNQLLKLKVEMLCSVSNEEGDSKLEEGELADQDWRPDDIVNEQGNLDIQAAVTEAASEAQNQQMLNEGYVLEPTSGLYYHSASGYYFDAERSLFYDTSSGCYYSYNASTGDYEFHSQVDATVSQTPAKRRKQVKHKEDCSRLKRVEEMLEDGEVASDTEMKEEVENLSSDCSCDEVVSDSEEADSYPPCIRVVVKKAPTLQYGSLFIIPFNTPTVLGSCEESVIRLPDDDEVAEKHCELRYSETELCYLVQDLRTTSGTFLNNNRIAFSRQASAPQPISHGDVLRLGSTELLLHVHKGSETCDDCEPGKLQKNLSETASTPIQLNREEKEQERRDQNHLLKMRLGLKGVGYLDQEPKGYKDRAKERRKMKGSDLPETAQSHKPAASLHRSIAEDNKGFQMLSKMGWKPGEAIGDTQKGILEPVPVQQRMLEGAGLGSSAGRAVTNPADSQTTRKQQAWAKARQRYETTNDQRGKTNKQKFVSCSTDPS